MFFNARAMHIFTGLLGGATWTFGNLGNLDFGQFGKLGLCIPWVTWTLYTFGDLGFGQFVNCNYWETYVSQLS